MKSIKSRKQRKELFNAPIHKRRKWISAHLEENLLLKYNKRSVPVIKGDAVRVMRGSFKGHEDKVVHVNIRRRQVEIEGMTMTKADNKKIAKPIHASNLMITKLNLTDKWRRNKLESDLSEETKKEIEKEAKEQIKEVKEEEKRKAEEMEEPPVKEPEEPAEKIEETVKKTAEQKKPVEKKTTSKAKPKKEEVEKPKAEKKTTLKKPTEKKKTPAKKETVKKTPGKTAKKEKEENK
jgi:large subunit ribosomal protein L24